MDRFPELVSRREQERVIQKPSLTEWFTAQSKVMRVYILLSLMHELTISFRDVKLTNDQQLIIHVGTKISELNHRVAAYASAMLDGSKHYPEEVLLGMVTDTLSDANVAPFVFRVWERVARAAERHLVV